MIPGRITYFPEFEMLADSILGDEQGPRLMAVLFMRKGQPIAEKEIIPSLGWFDVRSGRDIHFVLAGWSLKDDVVRGSKNWDYSDAAFGTAVHVFEENSTWRYSGGTELLLFTAKTKEVRKDTGYSQHNWSTESSSVDFSSAITLHLDLLREKKLIDSPERLFQIIFNFTKTYTGDDPVRALAMQEMRVSLANGISKSLMSLIPKDAKEKAEYAAEFAVKDLSRAAHKPMLRIKSDSMSVGLPI
ncbi:hypothetical protein [Bradyrhizobium sp. STM 3562]|uniref:hypothetical protein n=1 Tax=Bradyrhizobium sp. STM 3562 TaxID=578924 RepID=UPI00388F2833